MITTVVGPLHGALYPAVVLSALFGRSLLMSTRLLALVPVLGGVFMLVNVRREARRASTTVKVKGYCGARVAEHPLDRFDDSAGEQDALGVRRPGRRGGAG